VRGRKALAASFPDAALEFKRVDIDKPLTDQRIEPGSYDLIHAVNTLHVSRDLLASLQALREALAPGGVLVLGEATRPVPGQPIGFEFVFQLTEAFRRFQPIEGLREEPGFLGWEPWLGILERAGFKDPRTTPDMRAALDAYPKHTICALVANA
jgi:SAM-dependent methyltransferase